MDLISIVLPNLNTNLSFLEARLASIINQTCEEWECIVIDGFSENGSWEYLQQQTKNDNRFQLYRKPKKGIYDAWNEGIRLSKGDYIYIAPSDDLMKPDFLVKMKDLLRNNKTCDIACCKLEIIDENATNRIAKPWKEFWVGQYFGQSIEEKHIRIAPHDGVLHCCVQTVYTSITQILFKKRIIEETGFFSTNFGVIADFEFGMRISLIYNTVYTPEPLAAWRLHSKQATNDAYNHSVGHRKLLVRMLKTAVDKYYSLKSKQALKLNLQELTYVYKRDEFYFDFNNNMNKIVKLLCLIRWSFNRPEIVLEFLKRKMSREKAAEVDQIDYAKNLIYRMGLSDNIKRLH